MLAHPDFTTAASDVTVERLIADQLAGLPPELRDALAVIALAEPLGATIMERLSDTDALVALERRLLIRPEYDGRRLDISVRHPVYGAHVRATTSQLLARGIRGQLIDVVLEFGARRADDLVRLADWSVKVARPLPPEVAIQTAAAHSRVTIRSAPSASAVWRGRRRGPPPPPGVAAEARYERGDGQKVLDLVAAALPAADPATADRLVDVGVRSALFKLGDPTTARSFLTASGRPSEHIGDGPIAIDALTPLDRATELVTDGRLLDAEAELRSAFDEATIDVRSSSAFTAASLGWVLMWLGRPAEGNQLARRAALALAEGGHVTLAKWAWLATGLAGVTARSPATVDEALAELDLTLDADHDRRLPLARRRRPPSARLRP